MAKAGHHDTRDDEDDHVSVSTHLFQQDLGKFMADARVTTRDYLEMVTDHRQKPELFLLGELTHLLSAFLYLLESKTWSQWVRYGVNIQHRLPRK